MNRQAFRPIVMTVGFFLLLWGEEFPCVLDAGESNAWAKQIQNLTPSTTLSSGRESGPIGLPLTIAKGSESSLPPGPVLEQRPAVRRSPSRASTHLPSKTGDGNIRQVPAVRGTPGAEKEFLAFKDGLLTLEANQRPLSEILGQISEAAGIEIILFDPIHSDKISVSFKDRHLNGALRTILKGYCHCVVYNPKKEGQGVRIVQ